MGRSLLLAALGTLALAGTAEASTVELGAVAPPGSTGSPCGACSFIQSSSEAPVYAVPAGGGVITSFSVRGGTSVSGDAVRLRVFTGTADTGYTVKAESADANPPAGSVGTFATKIPVSGGEVLGLHTATSGDTAPFYAGQAGDSVASVTILEPGVGGSTGPVPPTANQRVNVSARLESDNNHNGLGDDTQEPAPAPAPPPADTDHDGVSDLRDVCPLVANADQLDADLDRVGDLCDKDDDNDGVSDDAETFLRTSRTDVDTDDDGLSDSDEERRDTDPRRADTDRDGLPDGLELGLRRGRKDPPGAALGTNARRFHRDLDPRTHTNPLRRDTDGDHLADGREDRNHNGRRDRGETDPRRRDTDRDGVPDGVERFPLDRRR